MAAHSLGLEFEATYCLSDCIHKRRTTVSLLVSPFVYKLTQIGSSCRPVCDDTATFRDRQPMACKAP